MQLKNEFNLVKKDNLLVHDHALKINGIVECLASIEVFVVDDKVEVCLSGIGP